MNFLNNLFEMPFCVGILFIIFGSILYLFPPKKINIIYGYKTDNSMKSQESWNFAQKYSSIKMIQSGVFLILSSLISQLLELNISQKKIIGFSLLGLSVFYIIYFTEKKLKTKFSIK